MSLGSGGDAFSSASQYFEILKLMGRVAVEAPIALGRRVTVCSVWLAGLTVGNTGLEAAVEAFHAACKVHEDLPERAFVDSITAPLQAVVAACTTAVRGEPRFVLLTQDTGTLQAEA